MRRCRHVLVLAALLAAGCVRDRPGGDLLIGAAASLSGPLDELVAAYVHGGGGRVATTLGSSGQLAQQIRQGAPIDLFLSADAPWIDTLIAEGRIVPRSRAVYARGRLALWSRDSAATFTRIEDLADPSIRRIAIADPEFAPYGRAAREALAAANVRHAVEPRIIIAGNVRQALQYAQTGNVDVAIVAHSLVQNAGGHTALVPAALHAPLDHALGVVTTADTAAAFRFAAFVLAPAGRAILARHGFVLPEP